MPRQKDFKRLVRERMRATGEMYTQARAALAPTVMAEVEHNPSRWLVDLGDRTAWRAAYERLQALPAPELIAAVLPGLTSDNWRVRKHVCALLDDVEFTDATFAGLTACLSDPTREVRRAAMHTLSCQQCKPEGCFVDVRGVFERMKDDPSADVRRQVLGPLIWWENRHDEWCIELMGHFAQDDPSERLRNEARAALDQVKARRTSDERRRRLAEALRLKTERHPGRWVYIEDGRIVGVDLTRKMRRHFPSATSYYVWPRTPTGKRVLARVGSEPHLGIQTHTS